MLGGPIRRACSPCARVCAALDRLRNANAIVHCSIIRNTLHSPYGLRGRGKLEKKCVGVEKTEMERRVLEKVGRNAHLQSDELGVTRNRISKKCKT